MFKTKRVSESRDAIAPDGSDVRVLLNLAGGSLAHFELAPGEVSVAVRHRTVEEIWYVLSGRGRIWRRFSDRCETVEVEPGICITIPVGTSFQFRCDGASPLGALGVTMPPWPGDGEAIRCQGPWESTAPPGPGLADAE